MDITQIQSIFSPQESNYLKYPQARKILKSVSIDLRILENPDSSTRLRLDQFITNDLIKKTNKLKLIILKIQHLIIYSLFCFNKKKRKQTEACNAIINYAKHKLENSITGQEMAENLENFDATNSPDNLPKPQVIIIDQPFQHHLICDKLASISIKMRSASLKKQKAWKEYLTKFHNTPLVYPDHSIRKLKTTIAQSLINNEAPQISVVRLHRLSDEEILQVMKIEREAFSSMDLIGKAKYNKNLHKRRIAQAQSAFYAAKDADKIVGVLEYHPNNKLLYSLARGAMYSQCRVASLLWEEFSKDLSGERIKLYVRESNPAIGIYEKWGFKEKRRIANFYRQPSENALIMEISS